MLLHSTFFKIRHIPINNVILVFPARLLHEQNKEVAKKLGIATACMFTIPFIVFYVCFYFIFHEKREPASWSGGAAVVAANLVIAGYVYSAFSEDDEFDKQKEGDESGPKVGAFKTRTD